MDHTLLPRLVALLLAATVLVAAGCQPDLALQDGAGGGTGGGSGGGNTVGFTLEPPAAFDAAARALRVRIESASAIDASRVRFVVGDVGPGHLKQLAADDPSNALEERILPASVWTRDDGTVTVAPLGLLESDERYAVAVPDHSAVLEIRTAPSDAMPILPRVWPPSDGPALEPLFVFCGDADLDAGSSDVSLGPDDLAATIEPGAASGGIGARCVRLRTDEATPPGTILVPPPFVVIDGATYGLDPSPLELGAPTTPPAPTLACEPSEVRFGPGCATVLDDRAVVRTPDEARLWVVGGATIDLVVATSPGEPFAVHPLPVAATFELEVVSLDVTGRAESTTVEGRTSEAVPHLILNEVLANAVGPEPASEWLEILNDGAATVSLAGHVIADLGGEVELPDVSLAPGGLALVVGDGWSGDGLDDVAPPPDAIIVRVPRIGRSGLANGGEPVRLRDPSGAIVSTIPAIESPDPGMSTARREPWLADAPSSFVSAVPTPGSPNAGS